MSIDSNPDSTPLMRLVAMAVHLYTATGLVLAFVAATRITVGDYRSAMIAMLIAVVIDATDGSLARAVNVKRHTPWVNGTKLDDLVDYLNYTFLPIFLIWHARWLPRPEWLWAAFPLIFSAMAFVHEEAKEVRRGFFRGFPSYWNVVAFYIALLFRPGTEPYVAATLLVLSVLCVLPIKFVYPSRPPCWPVFFLGGAYLWGAILLAMLCGFPNVPHSWIVVSLVYPAAYTILSFWLDRRIA